MESLGNDTGLKGRTIRKVVGEGGVVDSRTAWLAGSGTRFARERQIITRKNVKPLRRQNNSVENVFQRFALNFVSFLRRKHDFRRNIFTFV